MSTSGRRGPRVASPWRVDASADPEVTFSRRATSRHDRLAAIRADERGDSIN